MSKNATKKNIIDGLGQFLASSYMLYTKTQAFHWNVTGPHFQSLHTLFQTQYEELALAVDEIAERIRALGAPAPGGLSAFSKLSHIADVSSKTSDWKSMVKTLAADHEKLAHITTEILDMADAAGDQVTMDLMVKRAQVHQKTHWMLEATLG